MKKMTSYAALGAMTIGMVASSHAQAASLRASAPRHDTYASLASTAPVESSLLTLESLSHTTWVSLVARALGLREEAPVIGAKTIYRGAAERLFDQNAGAALGEELVLCRVSEGTYPGAPVLAGRVELQPGRAPFAEQLFDATPMDHAN